MHGKRYISILILLLCGCSIIKNSRIEDPRRKTVLKSDFVRCDTLPATGGKVERVRFMPGSNRIVTMGEDENGLSVVSFWNAASGQLEESLVNEDFIDFDIDFSNDGRSLAIGSRTAFLIRSDNFKLRRVFIADTYMAEKLIDVNREIAWPFAIKDVEYQKKYHFVTAVCFSPDDRHLASGHVNSRVKIWEVKTGSLLKTIDLSQIYGRVSDIEFSPDGRFFAACQHEGRIRVWGFPDYREKLLESSDMSVNVIDMDRSGRFISAGGNSGVIAVWDMESGKLLMRLKGHEKAVLALTSSSDGKYMASGSSDNTIIIWDMTEGESIVLLEGHGKQVNDLSFNSSSSLLASAGDDMNIVIWDISDLGLEYDPESIPLPAAPVRLEAKLEYLDRSGDGKLNPGEKARFRITVKNSGKGTAYDLVSLLTPESPDSSIMIETPPMIRMILPGRQKVFDTGVMGAAGLVEGTAGFNLRIYEHNGFHLARPIGIEIVKSR